jgi:hypothetical protein
MRYSKQDCIESLQQFAEDIGRSPEAIEFRESDYSPSVKTLENKFGSWNEAKKAAGLSITEHGANNDVSAAIRHNRKIAPRLYTQRDGGHEFFKVRIHGKSHTLFHHRLIAVAEHGFDAVCGNVVHHKNDIPWDNRPENLELMTLAEHTAHHNKQRASE